MPAYDLHLGIDYSGAATSTTPLPGLQVYAARLDGESIKCYSPACNGSTRSRHWTRREIAQCLCDLARDGVRFIAGIDHAFSFTLAYFQRYGLGSWPAFLADFVCHWPTHKDGVRVDSVRLSPPPGRSGAPRDARVGQASELRLAERWTSSAKSVFQFDMQGSVAKSSHAGIPWLKWLRDEAGGRIHFWPFDGWQPEVGKAVLAEVYPSLFRRRYPRDDRNADEQDAYATARWLADMDVREALEGYFAPPLTGVERASAALEGWILGVR